MANELESHTALNEKADPAALVEEVHFGSDGRGTDWLTGEVEATVADYFAMLRAELEGPTVQQDSS